MTLALGPSWLDPGNLLNTYGIWGLLLIVFAESGLLIGFFLPGDSLLFTCGLLITSGDLDFPLWGAIALICVAAILGDQAGYMFGKKVGPSLFNRPDSRLFKQENVLKAHEFFEKHGPKSLVLARFVPVVRTFTPIIAGVSGMKYRSFLVFNVIGGILWGAGVTLLGSWLGNIAFVKDNIEAMLILIVLISVVPIAIEFLRARSKEKKARAEQPEQSEPVQAAHQQPYPQPPAMDDATTRLRRIEPEPHEQPRHPEQQYWPQDYGQPQPQQPQPAYGNQPNQPYGHGGYADQGGYGQQGGQEPYYGQQPQQRPPYDGQGYGDPQQQYPYGYDQGGHRAP
ncbi:DedA family protein [Streptomyces sp. LaPpAH-108]|uniref:DedA family protein n=1 Tax=Streptomyces sp. LaPpAH-108 TaxID=1155714 RepID=UPI00035E93EB|nr:VTT domain-containing protein [Streptomyces sp. LaPpAH-108]